MRTSPPVTEVSGTIREAQNRNTSPSNICSGRMMSTGGSAAPSGGWIWFSSNSQRSAAPGRTSQMPMDEMTSPPMSRRPVSRVLPTSPSASSVTRTFSGRYSTPPEALSKPRVKPFISFLLSRQSAGRIRFSISISPSRQAEAARLTS